MMTLETLERHVDRTASLSAALWAKAALLGEARRLSNVGRARAADRGFAGNRSVDLFGALGELVLLTIAERAGAAEAAARMAAHMFHAGGGQGVEGPDLVVIDAQGAERGVDAKTFDCDPQKRYFAINDNKHVMLRGHCGWYFALLAAPFGQQALFARLIPHAEVETWPTRALRAGKRLSGSLSRNLPIQEFLSRHVTEAADMGWLRGKFHDPDEVERLANSHEVRADLYHRLPGLETSLQGRRVAIAAP